MFILLFISLCIKHTSTESLPPVTHYSRSWRQSKEASRQSLCSGSGRETIPLTIIPLCSKKIFCVIPTFLSLQRLVLWPNMYGQAWRMFPDTQEGSVPAGSSRLTVLFQPSVSALVFSLLFHPTRKVGYYSFQRLPHSYLSLPSLRATFTFYALGLGC